MFHVGRYQHPVRFVYSVVSLSSFQLVHGVKKFRHSNLIKQPWQPFGEGFQVFIIQSGSMNLPSYILKGETKKTILACNWPIEYDSVICQIPCCF